MKSELSFLRLLELICLILIIQSCATRLEFCECMSLEKAITDPLLLSEKEKKAKEEGCKWIHEELSDIEIIQKWAECTGNELNQLNQNQNVNKADEYNNNENGENEVNNNQSGEAIAYPIDNNGIYMTETVSLHYWANTNGNKPYAEMRFTDGTIFTLMPNCQGEYSWCIRNSSNVEIGYLKIKTDSEGEAVFIEAKHNENSSNYIYYLSKMIGTFRFKIN